MKNNKETGFIKIDTEAVVGKDDKPSTWKPIQEQNKEYWTDKSIKSLPLKEIYPRDAKNETEEEYNERLRMIGEYAMKDANDRYGDVYVHGDLNEQNKVIREPSENATPMHKNEKGKDVISGHRFVAYNPEKTEEDYEKLFANILKKEWIEDAVNDMEKAKKTGELLFKVKSPREYRNQQEMARFYIGRLIHDEKVNGKKVEQVGIFEDPGASYYSDDDKRFVNYKESDYASRDRKEQERVQLIDGKMFEGFFFPLVNQGFFDSKDGRRASFIATGKYDDFKNGADAAVLMPIQYKNRNGEDISTQQLLCFDLTIGHGNEKIDRINNRFQDKHGLSDIKYPTTCLGRLLGDVYDVPHFVICLTREEQTELRSFRDEVASGKMPTKEVQSLIDFQIFTQASSWADYWEQQNSPEKVRMFRNIELCFQKRLMDNLGAEQFVEKISQVRKRHSDATRFLLGLNNIQ